MAGSLQFTPQQFADAAHKWRSDLLMLPIIGIQDTLQYMTGRPGIRYKESVGTITGDAQFAPYNATRRSNFNLNVDYRTLETFFGSVVADFEPNTAVSTLLGAVGATKGDGQAQTPTAKAVLALVAKGLSGHLNDAIWSAKRNANGLTSADLFNGFDTITDDEIAGGGLSVAKGNYAQLSQSLTAQNAVDLAKEMLFSLDPHLRAQDLYMYCSQEFADKYNEAYLLTHAGVPYNNNYDQVAVEGSMGRLKLIPLANKANSKYIHITTKNNMLVGYDQMSDVESVEVKEFAPFVLSYIATMFFGVQFESIDKSRMKVFELV